LAFAALFFRALFPMYAPSRGLTFSRGTDGRDG
jgi:hypothetical protein